MEVLSAQQLSGRDGLDDWRMLQQSLHARFDTGSFEAGARLVAAIAEEAEELNHHPDVDLRYAAVTVVTTSHDAGGLTDRDLRLARRISARAVALGVSADPERVSAQEIAVDALDREAILPFWRAVLGYRDAELGYDPDPPGQGSGTSGAPDAVVDPDARHPAVWFQRMDAPRPQRNRIHLDVWVPAEVAERRVQEAIAAGGRLVEDSYAPAFWVLADAEGNEACVCTAAGRDD